jgi:hypothetical protein
MARFRGLSKMFSECMRHRRAQRPEMSAKHAPVAQLDRALDYESRGQEFESLRARQFWTNPPHHHGPPSTVGDRRLPILSSRVWNREPPCAGTEEFNHLGTAIEAGKLLNFTASDEPACKRDHGCLTPRSGFLKDAFEIGAHGADRQ